MTTVLIPLDSSRNSEICLDFYLRSVHREGNRVCTCYIADYFGDVGVMQGPSPGRVQELKDKDHAKAKKIEDTVMEIFKTHNINGDFKYLEARETWHKILEHGKEINATMIVIGSRGLGKFRRTVMGSVSESVLHHSEIPVLICKHN